MSVFTVARGGLTFSQALTAAARWAQKGWRPIEARMVIPIPDRPAPEAGPR